MCYNVVMEFKKDNRGGARVGAGRKKEPTTLLKEAINNLEGDMPAIIEELKKLALGKPVKCPNCGAEVGLKQIDREAGIYLVDRIFGKPTIHTELDITDRIELSSEQIERIIQRYQIAERLMLSQAATQEATQAATT